MKIVILDPISFRTNRPELIFIDLLTKFQFLIFLDLKTFIFRAFGYIFWYREGDFWNPDEKSFNFIVLLSKTVVWREFHDFSMFFQWFSMIFNGFQCNIVYSVYIVYNVYKVFLKLWRKQYLKPWCACPTKGPGPKIQ